MKQRALAIIVCLLGLGTSGVALAQVSGPGPYVSPVRDQCITEMDKDAQIRVACMNQYSADFHDQDARQAVKNKKHVVLAYGALWSLMTVFVVLLWMRQRKMSAEIGRLETELKKAMEQ